jgi:acyl-CoA thioesterase FadM
MIYYWFRLGRILLSSSLSSPLAIGDEIALSFRVRALDCDGLQVMTASQYAIYMDFARWALITRNGFIRTAFRNGWAPTVGSQKIIYRKPLRRWSPFKVRVSCVGWDEKWAYHLHLFEQHGKIKAIGVTKAMVWKKGRAVPFEQVLKQLKANRTEMVPPVWILDLFERDHENLQRFLDYR